MANVQKVTAPVVRPVAPPPAPGTAPKMPPVARMAPPAPPGAAAPPPAPPIQARVITPPPPVVQAPPADKAGPDLAARVRELEKLLADERRAREGIAGTLETAKAQIQKMGTQIADLSVVPEFYKPADLLPSDGKALVPETDWRSRYQGASFTLHSWKTDDAENFLPANLHKGVFLDVFAFVPRDNAPLSSGMRRVKGEKSIGAMQRSMGMLGIASCPSEDGAGYAEIAYMREDEINLLRQTDLDVLFPLAEEAEAEAPPTDPNQDLIDAGFTVGSVEGYEGEWAYRDGLESWISLEDARKMLAPKAPPAPEAPKKSPGRPRKDGTPAQARK